MARAQGAEPVGAVLPGVHRASRAQESPQQETDHRGEDPLAVEAFAPQVPGDARPQLRKRAQEGEEPAALALLPEPLLLSEYRYCQRPTRSRPIAWTAAPGEGLIQTSVHAGGRTSASIRSRSVFVTGAPSTPR